MYGKKADRILIQEGKGSLVSAISKSRYEAPILVVEPRTKTGFSIAQRDRRVDGVLLTYRTDHKLITRSFLQTLKRSGKFIELDITPVLKKDKASVLRKLFLLTREFNATETKVLGVLEDGLIRKYRDLRSVLTVLGINWNLTDSTFMDDLIETNQKKIEGKYFHDGIEVME